MIKQARWRRVSRATMGGLICELSARISSTGGRGPRFHRTSINFYGPAWKALFPGLHTPVRDQRSCTDHRLPQYSRERESNVVLSLDFHARRFCADSDHFFEKVVRHFFPTHLVETLRISSRESPGLSEGNVILKTIKLSFYYFIIGRSRYSTPVCSIPRNVKWNQFLSRSKVS